MTASPEVVDEVLQSYRRLRSPYKVARELGYAPVLVWQIIELHADTLTLPVERWDGRGRPELEQHLVAKMKPGASSWDNAIPEIAEARRRFEAGTHTMATGRDGRWLLLYSIPLRKPQPARPDFFKNRSY